MVVSKLTAFSQKDTNIDTTKICFPTHVAKQIIKDVVSGDSAKAQLHLSELEITKLNEKVNLKDSIITTTEKKYDNCLLIVEQERLKYGLLNDYTKRVEKDLRKEKIKNKFKSIVGGSIVLILGTLYIIK